MGKTDRWLGRGPGQIWGRCGEWRSIGGDRRGAKGVVEVADGGLADRGRDWGYGL